MILDVDLLAFEQGSTGRRRAVVDGVMRSLRSGFVYVATDLTEDLLDHAYGQLDEFFDLPTDRKDRSTVPGSHGQAGYTGLLVETAAGAELADWKEMLNWGAVIAAGHPLRRRFPHRYHDPVLPEADVPGITATLTEFHERVLDVQRRVLRIIATGLGAHEEFFDLQLEDGPTLSRAIRYPPMSSAPGGPHVWAGEHRDINLITLLPRATARGLEIATDDGWVDAAPPAGHAIVNTGIMLARVSNGLIPAGRHRVVAAPHQEGHRLSVVQFCHPTPWTILQPVPTSVDDDNPLRYAPIEAGDLLDTVLHDINLLQDPG